MYGGYKQGNNIICNCLLSVNVFDLRVSFLIDLVVCVFPVYERGCAI